MTERRYTIDEIDALRCCEKNVYLYGNYSGPDFSSGQIVRSRSYREEVLTQIVEERVRTYMMAGLVAQDLLGSAASGEQG